LLCLGRARLPVGDLALVLLFARQILLAAQIAVQKQVLRRLDAPVTERNRFVALTLKLFLIVRNATVVGLDGKLGHQVNRFLVDGEQLNQTPEVRFQYVARNRAVVHAAGDAGLVLIATDAISVGSSSQPGAEFRVILLLSQRVTVRAEGQRTQRIGTGFALDAFVLGTHRAVLAHLSHLAHQLQWKDGPVLSEGNLIGAR